MEGLVCLHPQLQTGSQRPRKGGEGHEGPRGCSIRSRGAEGTGTPRQRGALPVTESHLQPVPGPLGAHPSPGARPGWLPRLGGFPQGEVAGGPLLTQAVCRDAQVSCRTRDGILSTPGRADSRLTPHAGPSWGASWSIPGHISACHRGPTCRQVHHSQTGVLPSSSTEPCLHAHEQSLKAQRVGLGHTCHHLAPHPPPPSSCCRTLSGMRWG